MSQLSFADIELGSIRKPSRIIVRLAKLTTIVNWDKVCELVKEIDYTNTCVGGRTAKDILSKINLLFLQHLHNLSDPELEDQVNDRLSFEKFAGIDYTTSIPDYTTIW
jgi:hypothetical protein